MLRIGYFVHDLTDPAVAKRVRMLRFGGADPVVIGFRRSDTPVAHVAGAPVIDLGRTFDANFKHRALATATQALRARALSTAVGPLDALVARNLEMLVIAQAVRRLGRQRRTPLAYECLDVHRLMLREDLVGRALRSLEGLLMRSCNLLIVSSPAFLRAYFERHHASMVGDRLPAMLVENKVFSENAAPVAPAKSRRIPQRPWRIGWFGAIRCRRSFEILRDLAERRPDLVTVVVRGRPTPAVFEDLAGEVAGRPNITFSGPYSPDQLPQLYRDVHFTWAIDYFEDGANSAWLLPNRIYEGGLHATPALALRSVETGLWLSQHKLGVLMDDPASELEALLEEMTARRYLELEAAARAAPQEIFVAGGDDCSKLTQALAVAA